MILILSGNRKPSLRKLISRASKKYSNDNDLNLLQLKLKDRLSGKKFLIVLDDVWNENYANWNIL